jgi:AcrR family transcriptional regulator
MTSDDGEPAVEPRPAPGPVIPASVQAAWGRPVRAARGPRPGLSLDRIVAAAIAVADADGLDAVSMSRVAAELGSSAMSLYRYVGSKDELLALMVDVVMDRITPAPPGTDWREGLQRWAASALAAYLGSRWVVRVPIPAPPITPNQVRALEAGLACLAGSGLTAQEKLSTILTLSGLARYYATLALDFTASFEAAGGQDPNVPYGTALRELIDPDRFPEVTAAVAALEDDDPDFAAVELRFAVGLVLDGVAVLMGERRSAQGG